MKHSQRLVLALWPYWLGFTLGQLILWPFGMANAGVLVGLYVGSMVPIFRDNGMDERARTPASEITTKPL